LIEVAHFDRSGDTIFGVHVGLLLYKVLIH
jgi:hypothetical protein